MGAGAVGAVAVGVYATSPAEEMGYVLEHADIELVVCEDQEQVDKVLQVADRLPGLRRIVVIETKGLRSYAPHRRDRDQGPAFLCRRRARASLPSRRSRKTASGARTSNRALDAALDGQRLADIGLMIYTSGSTGKPKGAMLSYRNMRGVAWGIAERLEMTRAACTCPICRCATWPSRCCPPSCRSTWVRR